MNLLQIQDEERVYTMYYNENSRFRNWLITINYKSTLVWPDKNVQRILREFSDITYYVFQLEQGEKGTYHHHLFICFQNAKSFSTIKNKFHSANLAPVESGLNYVRDYCSKVEGRVRGPVEYGTFPQQGKRSDLDVIYELIKDGVTDLEISEKYPSAYIKYHKNFKSVRQELLEEKYSEQFRKLDVTYIYGDPGTGKSRYVMDKFGYKNVYRITNYAHPFDQYQGEDIIVFEEFRSSLKIEEMLNYLDGYPFRLPARYENRVACYTKVYVITNICFFEQYHNVQDFSEESFAGFARRFNKGILHFKKNSETGDTIVNAYSSIREYLISMSEQGSKKDHLDYKKIAKKYLNKLDNSVNKRDFNSIDECTDDTEKDHSVCIEDLI